ncbi:outer membrane beta-barrel protein [Mariniflexile ostreae]|uniref:Outer membrane beta-barrel protein n=1 Tax=Mariniflexile ostreae TaxID=1520892 RepID=A0ABV5FDJ0_9FLAO
MKKLTLLIFLFSLKSLYAQGGREITYGLFAGGLYSTMSNLPDVIVPKGVYEGYTLEEKGKFGATAGIMINWKYPYAKISVQPELSYSFQATDLAYEDIHGLNYKMTFAYSYLNAGMQFKYYPIEGMYVGIGPSMAFNITSDNITYSSNAEDIFGGSGTYYEPDTEVQNVLNASLTGKNYFYGTFSLGYEFNSQFFIGARYALGISDALATEENGHRYQENTNKINSISLYIGYAFDFDDLTNF